jgi:TRAP-type mannitol/chloroaromatic compound transport system permease large subunit
MRHLTSTHAQSRRARATLAPAEINPIDIDRAFVPFVCLRLLVLIAVLFFPWLATTLR